MKTRKLGTELEVYPVGLGCMGMSFAYGGQPEAEAIATLHRAVEIVSTSSTRPRSTAPTRTRSCWAKR